MTEHHDLDHLATLTSRRDQPPLVDLGSLHARPPRSQAKFYLEHPDAVRARRDDIAAITGVRAEIWPHVSWLTTTDRHRIYRQVLDRHRIHRQVLGDISQPEEVPVADVVLDGDSWTAAVATLRGNTPAHLVLPDNHVAGQIPAYVELHQAHTHRATITVAKELNYPDLRRLYGTPQDYLEVSVRRHYSYDALCELGRYIHARRGRVRHSTAFDRGAITITTDRLTVYFYDTYGEIDAVSAEVDLTAAELAPFGRVRGKDVTIDRDVDVNYLTDALLAADETSCLYLHPDKQYIHIRGQFTHTVFLPYTRSRPLISPKMRAADLTRFPLQLDHPLARKHRAERDR